MKSPETSKDTADTLVKKIRREGTAESLYYSGSKDGKRRLSGDTTARQASLPERKDLRSDALVLKACVADLSLENRLLTKG